MIFVTFTSATLQVTADEDGQIRFVKGQVKPIDNRTVIRGIHIHSIAFKASEKLAALVNWENAGRFPSEQHCEHKQTLGR